MIPTNNSEWEDGLRNVNDSKLNQVLVKSAQMSGETNNVRYFHYCDKINNSKTWIDLAVSSLCPLWLFASQLLCHIIFKWEFLGHLHVCCSALGHYRYLYIFLFPHFISTQYVSISHFTHNMLHFATTKIRNFDCNRFSSKMALNICFIPLISLCFQLSMSKLH